MRMFVEVRICAHLMCIHISFDFRFAIFDFAMCNSAFYVWGSRFLLSSPLVYPEVFLMMASLVCRSAMDKASATDKHSHIHIV